MARSQKRISNKSKFGWDYLALELMVVFLGVTAGFLLNNWRTTQQEHKMEGKYLEGFRQDMAENISELEKFIEKDSLWLVRCKPLLEQTALKSLPADSASAVIKLILKVELIDYRTGTYEDITNSGNLNLINAFETRSRIIDFYLELKGVKLIDEYFYKYVSETVVPFSFETFDILSGKFTKPNITSTIQFSNIFAGYYSLVQQRFAAYKKLLSKGYKLEAVLNKI